MKRSIMSEATTPFSLISLDLDKNDNLVSANNLNIGTALKEMCLQYSSQLSFMSPLFLLPSPKAPQISIWLTEASSYYTENLTYLLCIT